MRRRSGRCGTRSRGSREGGTGAGPAGRSRGSPLREWPTRPLKTTGRPPIAARPRRGAQPHRGLDAEPQVAAARAGEQAAAAEARFDPAAGPGGETSEEGAVGAGPKMRDPGRGAGAGVEALDQFDATSASGAPETETASSTDLHAAAVGHYPGRRAAAKGSITSRRQRRLSPRAHAAMPDQPPSAEAEADRRSGP